jgi:hypothetical protein
MRSTFFKDIFFIQNKIYKNKKDGNMPIFFKIKNNFKYS